jgi:uncharacterized protein DUF6869
MTGSNQQYQKMRLQVISALMCLLLLVTPCFSKDTAPFDLGFEFTDKGLWVLTRKLSREESLQLRRELAHVTDATSKDPRYENFIVLEGTPISKLANDKYGQPLWLIKPEHIFTGADQIPGASVTVMSCLGPGRVNLKVGCRYRIGTVDFKHAGVDEAISGFYIWDTTVIKLQHSMSNKKLDALIDAWIAYYEAPGGPDRANKHWWASNEVMSWTGSDPELLWRFIVTCCNRDLSDKVIGDLAAGPLEDLIQYSGAKFIDRIEKLATEDQRFNYLLGGVWRSGPPDVWTRVELARKKVW